MPSIQEALSEAISKSKEGTLDTPVETPIETDAPVVEASAEPETAAEREQRIRDEKGRFAKGEKPEATPIEAHAPQAPEVTTRKPPSSWKKDYWDQWGRMDPKVQEYIEQREADYAKGVSTYKGQWDQAAPLVEAIQPFVPELQQHGIHPAQWIQNLGNAHRTLAMGSPEQKLQMFAKLATDYGVPIQALSGQQGDPQFAHVTQTVSTLQREVENWKQQQRAQEQSRLQQEIESFKKNAPHFEAVKDHMAQLLQSGMASDLPSAYDKAIRLHDDIWTQHQAQQAKDAEAARQAEIAKKKAAAVSPRSSGPTGQVATGSGKKDLRAVLSEAVSQHAGGRF